MEVRPFGQIARVLTLLGLAVLTVAAVPATASAVVGYPYSTANTYGWTLSDVVATDVDQDGHVDLLGRNGYGPFLLAPVVVSRGLGGANFAAPQPAVAGSFRSLIAANLNDDAHIDLVTYTPDLADRLAIYLGTGTLSYTFAGTYDANGQAPRAVADFDGDQKADIVSNTARAINLRPGDGEGNFGPPVVTPLDLPAGASVRRVDAGSIDGGSAPISQSQPTTAPGTGRSSAFSAAARESSRRSTPRLRAHVPRQWPWATSTPME